MSVLDAKQGREGRASLAVSESREATGDTGDMGGGEAVKDGRPAIVSYGDYVAERPRH